jgi:survival motor neuron protein
MASSSNVVKTTSPPNDDLFLCRAFAKAISSDKLLQIIEQQPITTESVVETIPSNDNSSVPSENNNQWKVDDLCLCPYSEDGLLYRATIIHIDSSSCIVSFDDYGNEEIHPLTDLQLRTNEEIEGEVEVEQQQQQQQQEPVPSIDEDDILPPPPPLPPFPVLNSTDDNDTLSSTLMSWYLAGYHTGFYQGINNKKF